MKSKISDFLKRTAAGLISAALLIPNIPVLAESDTVSSAILFKEDYQNVAVGGKPTYGASNWSGDTASSHGECTVGVVDENGNKSLLMQYIGEGKSITADPLVYRNINIANGETHVFTVRMKTDDTNQYKQLFLRSATGAKIELFSFNGVNVRTVGANTANLKTGTWYDVKVVLDGTEKKADVYVNGIYGGSVFLKNYDMTSMSIRITMFGATAEGAKTNVYIDNTAYANQNVQIKFEEPEYIESTPQPDEITEGDSSGNVNIDNRDISVFCIDNTKAYILGEFKNTGKKQWCIGEIH